MVNFWSILVNFFFGDLPDELGSEGGIDELGHVLVVVGVDFLSEIVVHKRVDVVQRQSVRVDDLGRVHVIFEELLRGGHDLAGQNDDRSCPVAAFFVLSSRNFDHRFGGRMLHHNFTKNSVSVVCYDDATLQIAVNFLK